MKIIEAHYPHHAPGIWSYVCDWSAEAWEEVKKQKSAYTMYRTRKIRVKRPAR